MICMKNKPELELSEEELKRLVDYFEALIEMDREQKEDKPKRMKA